MSGLVQAWQRWTPYFQSLLRIVAAKMFITTGTIKLFSFPMAMPAGISAPVGSQIWIAGMLEVFGGALLLLGLFTRPIAFLLSGEMAVAYFQFHGPKGFWPVVNGGVDAVLYCFIWLYFSAAGPGPLSFDALRKRR